jgi:hypothetical protein
MVLSCGWFHNLFTALHQRSWVGLSTIDWGM